MYDKMLTNNTSTQRPYYDPYSTVQCTQYSGFVCLPASSPGASCLLSGLYGTTEQKVSPGITYKVT